MTIIEDLSNELVYEMFEYLDVHHAFQSFYDLNERFQNLFVQSNLRIKINISILSKSAFHQYLAQMIVSQTHRIQIVRLCNPFAVDIFLLQNPTISNLHPLGTLIINSIEPNCIEGMVNQLSSLPHLIFINYHLF